MLSKLEAINEILTAAGEQAVLTLVSGAADTTNAETILNQETKKVLAKGWHFNTENGVEIQPDASGFINIHSDVLRLDPSDQRQDYVERGSRLYNLKDQTYVFTGPVKVNLIRSLDFEEVPFNAQDLIVQRAKKKYQRAYVGSQSLDAFNRADEADAQAVANDADAEDGNLNIFNNPELAAYVAPLVHSSVRRGRYA